MEIKPDFKVVYYQGYRSVRGPPGRRYQIVEVDGDDGVELIVNEK